MIEKGTTGTTEFYEYVWYRIAPHQISPEQMEAEMNLVLEALELPPGAPLLDLACGYGRLAIPLAQRGYAVTGIDLSRANLRLATRLAREAGVTVRWLRRDMRDIPFASSFQAVICMGAFAVLDSDVGDLQALVAVWRALQPGGRFLLAHKNREFWIRHFQPSQPSGRLELPDGAVSESQYEIDLVGSYLWSHEVFIEADGTKREYSVRERLYTLTELGAMLQTAGFHIREVWGDYDRGSYGLDSLRMIVLAQKPPD